jgi:sucrose-6-phosphate hydrolase SacC (GH32 family)
MTIQIVVAGMAGGGVNITETGSPALLVEVSVPAQNDWTDQGAIIAQGSAGQWDARLDGMLSPCTVIRKSGTLYLYYVGADGDRADGGPKNRKVGVATSTDGLSWTKYGSNPIIEYNIDDTAPETGEGGTFCAGGYIENDGTVNLFHGGIDEFAAGRVNTDIVLATSSDGLTFTNQGIVLLHGDTGVIGDDELSPIGAIYEGGKWWVYYSAKGSDVTNWTLTVASSTDKTNLNGTVEDVAGSAAGQCVGCGDPVRLSESKVLVPILDNFSDRDIEMRTTTTAALNDLSTLAVTYDFADLLHATIYLDRTLGKWLMCYINDSDRTAIRLRTATMVYS